MKKTYPLLFAIATIFAVLYIPASWLKEALSVYKGDKGVGAHVYWLLGERLPGGFIMITCLFGGFGAFNLIGNLVSRKIKLRNPHAYSNTPMKLLLGGALSAVGTIVALLVGVSRFGLHMIDPDTHGFGTGGVVLFVGAAVVLSLFGGAFLVRGLVTDDPSPEMLELQAQAKLRAARLEAMRRRV